MNEIALHGEIRGDVLKRGKQESYLREVLAAIVTHYNTEITWNALAQELSIDQPKTLADYVGLLERMDVVCVLPALLENKLAPAPKKARKLMFSDPFILRAVRAWLESSAEPFRHQIQSLLQDPIWSWKIVKACVTNHFRRAYPTSYIKAQSEVDVAYVRDGRFWPVKVKWTNQLRRKTLKQIVRYGNGEIWSKSRPRGEINGVRTLPLPIALLRIEAS